LRDHQDQNHCKSCNRTGKEQLLLEEILLIGLLPIRETFYVRRGQEQKNGNHSHPQGRHPGNSGVFVHRESVEQGMFWAM
jgi:hypothetical protein